MTHDSRLAYEHASTLKEQRVDCVDLPSNWKLRTTQQLEPEKEWKRDVVCSTIRWTKHRCLGELLLLNSRNYFSGWRKFPFFFGENWLVESSNDCLDGRYQVAINLGICWFLYIQFCYSLFNSAAHVNRVVSKGWTNLSNMRNASDRGPLKRPETPRPGIDPHPIPIGIFRILRRKSTHESTRGKPLWRYPGSGPTRLGSDAFGEWGWSHRLHCLSSFGELFWDPDLLGRTQNWKWSLMVLLLLQWCYIPCLYSYQDILDLL